MAFVDVFFGKTEDVREAESARRKAEDEMMSLDPRELNECPTHAQKDVQRLGVILSTQRLGQARQAQDSRRNMMTTVLSAVGVMAAIKGGPFWDWLLHALGLIP